MGGGKGGSDDAPEPDKNIGRAALKNAETGEQWLEFAKEQFEVANERQQDIDDLSSRIGEQQLETRNQADRWSREDRMRWETMFRPMEDMFLLDAMGGQDLSDDQVANILAGQRDDQLSALDINHEERLAEIEAGDYSQEEAARLREAENRRYDAARERIGGTDDQVFAMREAEENAQENAAARARADVQGSAAAQDKQRQREMASMGLDPRSGRFQGQERASDTQTALASAGAQNQARQNVRARNTGMRADAANMGRGLPSQAASSAGLGLQAGGQAMNTAHGAMDSFRANTGIMGQGFQGAMQGYNNQANILNQQYQNEMQSWQAQQQANAQGAAGLMNAVGTGIGAYAALSDEEKKTDKQPVSGALAAINGLSVESWKYTDAAQQQETPPGMIPPDNERHVGPYAQDFARETGKGDGTSIQLQDAVGLALKGIQELDRKIEGMRT